MTISWLRFAWDLQRLPTSTIETPNSYTVRAARREDEDVIQKVTASAFSMDTGWGDIQKLIVEKMLVQVGLPFEKDGRGQCIVLQHGSRIIGSSALCLDETAEYHLTTGPCILHEYRSRGLGSLLLQASLAALHEAGLKRAFGIARERSAVARFIYPKFGGLAEPWTPDFVAVPKIAA